MKTVFVSFLISAVFASSQIHIANDNYLMEKQRLKRDVGVTTCDNGMTSTTRNVFDKTIANGKTWDCTLEMKAQAVIKECLVDNGGVTNGTLKLSFPISGVTTADATISQYEPALKMAASNLNTKSSVTESIGCSFATCEQRLDILCLYSHASTLPPLP